MMRGKGKHCISKGRLGSDFFYGTNNKRNTRQMTPRAGIPMSHYLGV